MNEHYSGREGEENTTGRLEHLPARVARQFSGCQLGSPVLCLSLLRNGTALTAVSHCVQQARSCAQLGEQLSTAVLHLTLKCVRLLSRASVCAVGSRRLSMHAVNTSVLTRPT
jgi:hypothetical protein